MNSSGTWIRRGSNIVLLPGSSGQGQEGELEFDFVDPYPQRVIHPNIDVKAQRALLQMLKNPADRVAAQTLIDWVHEIRLHGIFQPDQKVPALAARKRGGWWVMLKGGKKARVFCETPGSLPILIFHKDLDRESLISIFRTVFRRDRSPVFAACSITSGAFCRGGARCEAAYTF